MLIFKQSTYAVVWSARELTAEEQEQIKACDNSNIEKWAFTTDRTFVLADKLGVSENPLKTRITVGETSFSFTNGSISHVVLIQVEKPTPTPTETPNPLRDR